VTLKPNRKAVEAFENEAAYYDEDFENSPAMGRLRKLTTGIALNLFKPGDTILEMNCGTGIDAITLASQGLNVTATDGSAAMVRETAKKIAQHNLANSIRVEQCPFEELASLRNTRFDGAFSNMGGLNCSPSLIPVAEALKQLIRPGGFLVACMLSRFSLWETGAFLLRGNAKMAFRRLQPEGADARLRDSRFRAYYHSPESVEKQFGPMFQKVSITGLNIFSPPPGSRKAYKVLGKARFLLEQLDDSVATLAPFNRIGDHFVIVLERKNV